MRSYLVQFLIASLCVVVAAQAPRQRPKSSSDEPLTPAAKILRAHGIQMSESSLIRALSNSDPEIRSVAALQLAEDHDFAAVPKIEVALKAELEPRARITMAQALWSLHDPKGASYLQTMCREGSLSIYVLVEVVQDLNSMGEPSGACVDPVLDYLAADSLSSDRRQAVVPALPGLYRWAPKPRAEEIVKALEEMLSDSSGWVKMEAGQSLVRIKSFASAGALREALSGETDPVVRASLQKDLDRLEQEE